jgi:hypothetical protein
MKFKLIRCKMYTSVRHYDVITTKTDSKTSSVGRSDVIKTDTLSVATSVGRNDVTTTDADSVVTSATSMSRNDITRLILVAKLPVSIAMTSLRPILSVLLLVSISVTSPRPTLILVLPVSVSVMSLFNIGTICQCPILLSANYSVVDCRPGGPTWHDLIAQHYRLRM